MMFTHADASHKVFFVSSSVIMSRASIRLFVLVICATALAVVDAYCLAGRSTPSFLPKTRLHQSSVEELDTQAEVPEIEPESSAAKYSGAGPVQVDMNNYNLQSLEDIAEEWTAKLVPANDFMEEGVYLNARNPKDIMVDTLKVVFARVPNKGLGIELLELAGGREDGLGITVVNGLVDGGCAKNSGLVLGDSITKVAVRKRGTTASADSSIEEIASIDTECLGYDATVDAIVSLPPHSEDDEVIVLTVKRLRRRPKVKVNFQYPPDQGLENISIELFAGENLRRSMLVKGIKLNDPLAQRFDSGGSGDCGAEGTCATCAVTVVKGSELLNEPSDMEKQIFTQHPRRRLACKSIVGYGMKEGEMIVQCSPRQWK